jgi:hypothetical protein
VWFVEGRDPLIAIVLTEPFRVHPVNRFADRLPLVAIQDRRWLPTLAAA